MTLTINEDCTSVQLTSDYFEADNISNSLSVSINGGDAITVAISASNVDPYDVDAETLSLESLPQGVYYFELTVTDVNSVVTTESLCIALICDLHCDMVDLYLSTDDLDKVLAYEALKLAQGCSTCSCSVMQTLYDTIIETEDVTNCDC